MSRRLNKKIIDAQTASATTSSGNITQADIANTTELSFYVEFSAGSSAGVVSIETSSSDSYPGTWAVLSTVTWAAASKSHLVQVTGALAAVRARITTAVTGGTVDVWCIANFQ